MGFYRQQNSGTILLFAFLTYLRHIDRHALLFGPASIQGKPPPIFGIGYYKNRREMLYLKRENCMVTPDMLSQSKTVEQLTQFYELQLQKAIDEERSRIARDIHDGAAQHIAHVLHKLEFIQRIWEKQPEVALQEIERTRALVQESLHDLRHDITSLVPAQLEEQGFAAALQSLLEEYRQNEPALSINYKGIDTQSLPLTLEAPIFRIIQEALHNIHKHAQANHVDIDIHILAGLLLVEVSDNGAGFDETKFPRGSQTRTGIMPHMGLHSMRKRVQQAGGKWEIVSKPGRGTTVKALFPLVSPMTVLTPREREVLHLLVEGLTNREIATRLSVSIETVKSHVHHIMQKMHVSDRTSLAVKATQQRWL